MENGNLREYEAVRKELADVKACATQYIGFVLGGSGLALFGFGLLAKESVSSFALIYSPMALSIMVTLILFILYYKFNSHNRFAAYCFVLSVERWIANDQNVENSIIWEPCIGKLVDIDSHPDDIKIAFEKLAENIKTPEIRQALDEFVTRRRRGTMAQWGLGLRLLVQFLLGRHVVLKPKGVVTEATPGSWIYPLWVTMPFVVVTGLFGIVPIYVGANILVEHWDAIRHLEPIRSPGGALIFPHEIGAVAAACLGTVLFHWRLWKHLLHKLYQLIQGDASVPSYARRFQVIRGDLLAGYGIKVEYR